MTQIEPNLPKEKAIVYVLRKVHGSLEVLVFDHIDFPDVNRQVPGGGIEPGESKENAALRELEEESGIMNARLIRYLGENEYENAYQKQVQRRHFFLVQGPEGLPNHWDYLVKSKGEDDGLAFHFYWRNLKEAEIGYDQGKGLEYLTERDTQEISEEA
ncbi:MAG: NUDIX domain-containing protein [Bacteroidota bacterium]